LADDFVPLNLTNHETIANTDFLGNGLRDPNLKRYKPESLPTGNCFPFNDPLAANEQVVINFSQKKTYKKELSNHLRTLFSFFIVSCCQCV